MNEIIFHGPKTVIAFDNLRSTMRHAYYGIIRDGKGPTHILSGREAIVGYEISAVWNDPTVLTFKNLAVIFDGSVPLDEMRFMQNGEIVGRIVGIS